MNIKYLPNKNYPELSKIIIKTSEITTTFYPIIFSENECDKLDVIEISEHIIKTDNLTQNIFNAIFYTFLSEFLEKYGEKFDCFKLYDFFEFDCELSLKNCNIKPENVRVDRKFRGFLKMLGNGHVSKKEIQKFQENNVKKIEEKVEENVEENVKLPMYLYKTINRGYEIYKIVFKCAEGNFKTKTIKCSEITLEDVIKLRDNMIGKYGLDKSSRNVEKFLEN